VEATQLGLFDRASPYFWAFNGWHNINEDTICCENLKCYNSVSVTVFRDVMSCSVAEVHQCFEGMYCLLIQSWRGRHTGIGGPEEEAILLFQNTGALLLNPSALFFRVI
jgi:hypothetical protein